MCDAMAFIFLWMGVMKFKVGNVGARLKINGIGWLVVASLFVHDTVLFPESEEEF